MCDKCKDGENMLPEYNFCPYCGQSFHTEEKKAINLLIDYCANQSECNSCLFYSWEHCLFNTDTVPMNWEKF